jgi:hypothetical protein
MVLDVLLLVLIVIIIAVAAAEGLLRALIMAFIFYLLSIFLGTMFLGFGIAHGLNDLVVGSLGAVERTPLFYQGIIFAGLLLPTFAGSIVLSHLAFSDTSIPALRWGDNVLGTLVGVFIALAFAAVVCNAWGVIVRETWQPYSTWQSMRLSFESSGLRPYMMDVLRIYRQLLFPFAASRYPIFFQPQG